jgi:hypothetical protein
MLRSLRILLAIAGAIAAVLFVTRSGPKLEVATGAVLKDKVPGVEVTRPDNQRAKTGETFDCEATAPDGSRGELLVATADSGAVSWEVVETTPPPAK